MTSPDFLRRAGVLAVANDLANAAYLVLPGLQSLRRALTRLLGVPIGLSGSGPTLWALYPSVREAETAATRVRDEARLGLLDSPGEGPPFVTATTITATSSTASTGTASTSTASAQSTTPPPSIEPATDPGRES